jgi:hypothetical protein
MTTPARSWGVLVETIERDAEHSRLVELEFAWAGYGDRIRVICGQAADILPGAQRTVRHDLLRR